MPRPQCLDAALEYLARGWCAVPLCPPDHAGCSTDHIARCAHPGAEPVIPCQAYRRRLPRPTELRLFWERNPQCNVGVLLGGASRLIAVALEGPEVDDLLAQLLPGPLPATLGFVVPGGERRLLYAIPPTLVVPRRRLDGPGCYVLVLGEGTPLVLPPSIHPNGATYSWNCSSPPPSPVGSPGG
jgi:hypothetical protein